NTLPVELRIRRTHSNGNQAEHLAVVLTTPDRAGVIHTVPTMESVHAPSLRELVVGLGRAHTIAAVSQTLGEYCRQSFPSHAGLFFMERGHELRQVWEWRSKQVAQRSLAADLLRKGPATQALRSGRSTFWYQSLRSGMVRRYLRRLFPGRQPRSVAFIPLCG